MSVQWSSPIWLWPLLLIAATGAVLWTVRAYGQTGPRISQRLSRVLQGLRIAVFLLLVLALAGPLVSRLLSVRRPAAVAIVLEDSGSMRIRDAGGDTLRDRWSAALTTAAAVDSLVSRLRPAAESVVLRSNGLDPVTEIRLSDPVIGAPDRHGTDLAALRRQVSDRLAGRPVRATVLISDGQETASRTGPGSRARASAGGRLFVVGVGDATGPSDRLIKDLRYPDAAYLGDEVSLEFAVDHRYGSGDRAVDAPRSITARLTGPDGVVAEKTVTSAAKLVPFEMSFAPAAEGLQAYELSVDLLDNERFPANNKTSLAVNVRRERARVLLLSDRPTWDVRFLAQAAAQEQRVALAVVYPAVGGLVFADSLTPWVAPQSPADWLRWDAVVLSGWTGPLADLAWDDLGRAVEQGLGLMVDAGGSSGPQGGPVPLAPPVGLSRLLPVDTGEWRWLRGPFFVGAPAAAAGHPILGDIKGLGGARRRSGEGLAVLPPLAAVAAAPARDGAEVLLEATRRSGQSGPPLVRNVLTVRRHGQGRVAWLGGRSLWELAFWERRTGGGSTPSMGGAGRRLVRNLLVWTAEGATESGLAFTGRQTFFQAGEPIRLGAQWRDMRGQLIRDRQLSLVLRGGPDSGDGSERSFALRRTDEGPGVAAVELPPLAAGRYTVQLVGAGEPPVLGPAEDLIVADNSIEMTQVRMDRRRLRQLADQGGGRFYDADKPADRDRLLADLAAVSWAGDEVQRRQRWDLRAGWPLLVIVAVLLGVEWTLRRRHGLL